MVFYFTFLVIIAKAWGPVNGRAVFAVHGWLGKKMVCSLCMIQIRMVRL